MLDKLFALTKTIFTIDEELKRLREDAKSTNEQMRRLAHNQARLYYEFQLQKERDAHAREAELLRLELRLAQERLKQLDAHLTALQAPAEDEESN